MTKRDIEKSRPYYFGEGEEFKDEKAAIEQAKYKRDKMIEHLGGMVDGIPQITINNNMVQVEIPIKWETD